MSNPTCVCDGVGHKPHRYEKQKTLKDATAKGNVNGLNSNGRKRLRTRNNI